MSKHIQYTCNGEVLRSKIGNEMVLMTMESGTYFGLDEVGSRIWELLHDSPKTLDMLCEILVTEYEIDGDTCRKEAKFFAEELVAKGLIIEEVVV